MPGSAINIKANAQEVINLKRKIDELSSALVSMQRSANPALYDKLNSQLQTTTIKYNNLRSEVNKYAKEQERASSSTNDMLNLFAKIGGTTAIIGLGKQIMDVRNEFQQLEIAFGTMLKSEEKAAILMKDLTKFAAETPFGLQSAASGAKQLLAYGSTADTVIKELTMLGDVAAGTGQQIGDLVYLYGTLRTQGRAYLMDIRQFAGRGIPIYDELAKVLNTSKDKVNDFVSAGKVGFKEVEQAFKNMTAQGGLYGGLMEEQSKSIGGRMEALKDNINSIFNQIGKDSEGFIYKSIDGINTLVENYDKVGKILVGLVATYGTYRAALIATTAIQNIGNIQAYASAFIQTARSLGIATAAQTAFNVSVKANPYVLLATAVVGLAVAVWALHDSTTAQEKAQERLNKRNEEAAKRKEDLQNETTRLIGVINSETASILQQVQAWDKLKEQYPEWVKNMTMAEFKALSLTEQQKLLNEALDNKTIKDTNAELQNQQKIVDELKAKIKEINIQENYTNTEAVKRLELLKDQLKKEDLHLEGLKNINKELEAQRLQAEFQSKPESERLSILRKQLEELQGQKAAIEGNITISGGLENAVVRVTPQFKMWSIELESVTGLISQIKNSIDALDPNKKTKDKSFWKKQKEDAEGVLEALDSSQLSLLKRGVTKGIDSKVVDSYKKATKEISEANKNLGLYDFSGKSEKKEESAADKAKKLQQELKALQAKLSNEQLRQKLDSKQKEIDADEEGFNKQLKQNALNYEKELQQIKEFEDDKTKERAEAILKFGKDKVSVDLPELSESNIKAQVEKLKQEALSAFNKSDNDVYKKITEQYQSYADQRFDIEKKFNKDIDTLIKLRDKAQEKGDKESVDKLNRSIAKATADKGKDLISFDFERMKEAPEYIRAFEDLGNTSTETLNSLLGQFEKYKEEAAKTLSPKELREYTATIQSIADELSSRDLYGSLIKQKDEAVKANQRLIKAENDLRLVQLGIGDPSLTEEEAIKRVNKAKDEYYNKNKKVLDTQKKIRDQISALAKEMSGLGNALGGTSGEIISFIGDITSFYTTASEGIEKVAQTGAQAISVVEKASVILTIISTAIQLMKQLNSILPDAFSQYEKYDEKIERINDMRDAVNEYEIAVLKANQAENSWFGNDSLRNLKDYKELQTKIFDSYRDKMLEEQAIYENKGSGGWLTNTFKSAVSWVSKITYGFDLLNKKYKEGTTAAVNNLRIETRKKSSGFLGSGIGGKSQKTEDLQTWINNNKDLFKKGLDTQLFGADGMLNQELAGVILEKYGDKLVGQTKETLEELKTLTEQYNEFRAQLREYVNSLYEPLVDNMVSSIWDWFDEGKNALDSFKDYAKQTFRDIVSDMIKTILLRDVFDKFQDNIAKLYEEYSKGNLTEAQLSEAVAKETNAVMDRYKTQLPAIQGMVDSINQNIKDATGIDLKNTDKSKGSSQTPSSGYSVSMSQDTGDKLVGIQTGSQMRLISLDQNVARIAQWNQPVSEKFNFDTIAMPLGALSQSSLRIERMMEENRNIAINSYYELKDINKNTKELYQMNGRLEQIERNTRDA